MNKVEEKKIPGIKGYSVTNYGVIYSYKRNKKIEMSQHVTKHGYKQIRLMVNGARKSFLVHRIVAMAFLVKIRNKNDINHKNGIKTDNRVSNIEWVTRSENVRHAFCLNLASNLGEKNPAAKLSKEDIISIRQLRENGLSFRKIGAKYGVTKTQIARIIHGKSWSSVLS